ncbi:MAG: hypothetical protein K6E91_01785 [Butyrivibrio sp.]|nr:hypothetical protein [Butyrivibrio sp.]
MATIEEVQSEQTTTNSNVYDDFVIIENERTEDIASVSRQDKRSENFFVRFLNFITGRSRRRPGRQANISQGNASQSQSVIAGNNNQTTARQEWMPAAQEENATSLQQNEPEAASSTSAIDPEVRAEVIQSRKNELSRKYIEFVDAQPIVKVLVKRNMSSLALCRMRFNRYLGEIAEKAADIDLRHSVEALEGQDLSNAQNERIRERLSVFGFESEDQLINSKLYDNNGDGFLPLVFPQGFNVKTVESRLNNQRLTTDLAEADAFVQNFGRHKLFTDNYTSDRDDMSLAYKVGMTMLSRIAFRQHEMIDDILNSIAGLEGGELVRSLDALLENYTFDMLGKAVLVLPNVLEEYINLAKIPFPPVDRVDDALDEIEQMNSIRKENEAIGVNALEYKDSKENVTVPARIGEAEIREMFDTVVGRSELVREFVEHFSRTAGITGTSIPKRAPLAVISDLVPFVIQAGRFGTYNDIIKDYYVKIMQSNSRRECEAYISIMFETLSTAMPKPMQKIAFRDALIC